MFKQKAGPLPPTAEPVSRLSHRLSAQPKHVCNDLFHMQFSQRNRLQFAFVKDFDTGWKSHILRPRSVKPRGRRKGPTCFCFDAPSPGACGRPQRMGVELRGRAVPEGDRAQTRIAWPFMGRCRNLRALVARCECAVRTAHSPAAKTQAHTPAHTGRAGPNPDARAAAERPARRVRTPG